MQDKYNFFRQGGPRPTKEQMLHTKVFYRNAGVIYASFDEWKDIDRFYFIPLYPEMVYCIAGKAIEMAPDPVWLGSFIRCNMEYPELFQVTCPKCEKAIFPYRYVGSPLSGRVDLEYECKCGKKGYEMVTGWRLRATTLRDQLASDKLRHCKYELQHQKGGPATVQDLLKYIGLTDDEIVIPKEEHRIARIKLGKGRWVEFDSAGGYVVVDTKSKAPSQ
ncbi:MAG: hypothetical protein IAB80_04825 [Bacteroidetes bacterium]|uniref:Uncharacterized protein n=1 Tax=Candidatus Cryptobacteroides excrementipullorum TaxID=2840761 RepID=A0A9D9NLT4_9BACT|nr:hypothetical protein [Candidatus Cryptobacteroides excrementipullorum]